MAQGQIWKVTCDKGAFIGSYQGAAIRAGTTNQMDGWNVVANCFANATNTTAPAPAAACPAWAFCVDTSVYRVGCGSGKLVYWMQEDMSWQLWCTGAEIPNTTPVGRTIGWSGKPGETKFVKCNSNSSGLSVSAVYDTGSSLVKNWLAVSCKAGAATTTPAAVVRNGGAADPVNENFVSNSTGRMADNSGTQCNIANGADVRYPHGYFSQSRDGKGVAYGAQQFYCYDTDSAAYLRRQK